MKKFAILITMLLTAAFLFAETYEVKSVSGKVTYESAPGKWTSVKKGQKISESTVLNTSVNSKVVLVLEDKSEVTIKPMQKDTAAVLVKAHTSVAKGLRKSPSIVVKSETGSDVTENSKGTLTASSRASEAKDDLEIDE